MTPRSSTPCTSSSSSAYMPKRPSPQQTIDPHRQATQTSQLPLSTSVCSPEISAVWSNNLSFYRLTHQPYVLQSLLSRVTTSINLLHMMDDITFALSIVLAFIVGGAFSLCLFCCVRAIRRRRVRKSRRVTEDGESQVSRAEEDQEHIPATPLHTARPIDGSPILEQGL